MNRNKLFERIKELSEPMEPVQTELEEELKPLQDIRCVAFDFYGTMFISGVGDIGIDEDTGINGQASFKESLTESAFSIRKDNVASKGIVLFEKEIDNYRESHRKKGIDYPEPNIIHIWYNVLKQLRESDYIAGDLDRDIAERFSVEFEFRMNPIWPMPELISTLEKIAQRNILLGIISNSQFYTPLAFKALTGLSLKEAGFESNLLVWSFRASVKKPSLQLYKEFINTAKQTYKIEPSQILYIGNDVLKDVKPAKETGMHCGLFAGDKRSLRMRRDDDRVKNISPDIIIKNLPHLLDCLNGISVYS